MIHRKHNADVGSVGKAAEKGDDIIICDESSLPDSRRTFNPESNRKSSKAVAFAIELAAPDDLGLSTRIDARRFRFLFAIRSQIPDWLWLATKKTAVINQNGLVGLTAAEKRRLINAFGQSLGGVR